MFRSSRILMQSAIGMFLLSGCVSLTEPYRTPEMSLPDSFNAQGSKLQPLVAVESSWWENFGDAYLDQLVIEALVENRDLQAAIARVEASRARRGQSAQGYMPTGGPALTLSHRELASIEGQGQSNTYRSTFDATWEIDLFGRVRHAVDAADARLHAAEASLEDIQWSIAAEVSATYFEWRGAQQRIDILKEFIADQTKIVELTSARVDNGEGNPEDLSRARSQLASDKAALLSEIDRDHRLQIALAVLVGRIPGEWRAPSAPALAPLTVQSIGIADPRSLLRRRPDVRVAERRLAAATADIGVATADLFPQVSVGGFLGYIAGTGSDLVSPSSSAWVLTPRLSWGLFDLGRVRASIRASKAESRARLAEYEHAVLRALADAEGAFGSYAVAQQRLISLTEQTREATRAATITRARYEEGDIDYLVALDSARTARMAEMAFVEAVVTQRTATLAVHKALGSPPFEANAIARKR